MLLESERSLSSVAALGGITPAIGHYECRVEWDDGQLYSGIRRIQTRCHKVCFITKDEFPFRAIPCEPLFLVITRRQHQVRAYSNWLYCFELWQRVQMPGKYYLLYLRTLQSGLYSIAERFPGTKHTSLTYFIARVLLDIWVQGTLDPYTFGNYSISSTRCTRVTYIDCANLTPMSIHSMINQFGSLKDDIHIHGRA